MILARRTISIPGVKPRAFRASGSPLVTRSPVLRKPASRENPTCVLWSQPTEGAEFDAVRYDPSLRPGLTTSPQAPGFYGAFKATLTANPGAARAAWSAPSSFPATDAEVELSALLCAWDHADALYNMGCLRGFGEAQGGLASGSFFPFAAGAFRGASTGGDATTIAINPAADWNAAFIHPGDAVSSTDPTAMVQKTTGMGPATNGNQPRGLFSPYRDAGIANLRRWASAFAAALDVICDNYRPPGGGEIVPLCKPARCDFDFEERIDIRNWHQWAYPGPVRWADPMNHVNAKRPDGTPTLRYLESKCWRDDKGNDRSFEDYWLDIVQGENIFAGGPGTLPIGYNFFTENEQTNPIYLLGIELERFAGSIQQHVIEAGLVEPLRERFGWIEISNYDTYAPRLFAPGMRDYSIRNFRLTRQAIETYSWDPAPINGAPSRTTADRLAEVDAKMARVDGNRPTLAWISRPMIPQGQPGAATGQDAVHGWGDLAYHVEYYYHLWKEHGIFDFHEWGFAGNGDLLLFHQAWTQFRARVDAEINGRRNSVAIRTPRPAVVRTRLQELDEQRNTGRTLVRRARSRRRR